MSAPNIERSEVGRAALALIDDWGVRSVSVSSVASVLEVSVESIEVLAPEQSVLIDLALEIVYAEVNMDLTDDPWQVRFRRYSHDLRAAMLRHPNTAVPMATRPVATYDMAVLADRALRILIDDGFDAVESQRVLTIMIAFIVGHVLADLGTSNEIDGHMDHNHASPNVEAFKASLDGSVPIARDVLNTPTDRDAEFELGLDLLISGLEMRRAIALNDRALNAPA